MLVKQRRGILRSQVRPGDIVMKLNPESENASNIKTKVFNHLFDKYPEYGHGGLGVGNGKLVEVNGNLPKDKLGRSRSEANIHVVDLETDVIDGSFDIFRCLDTDLAETVAIEAFPFAAQGHRKAWGYSLEGALSSVDRGLLGSIISDITFGKLGNNKGVPAQYSMALADDASALDVANAQRKKFFCTQFVVWLYNLVGQKSQKGARVIPINPKDAYPGALVEALDKSPIFSYAGTIRGVAGGGNIRNLF